MNIIPFIQCLSTFGIVVLGTILFLHQKLDGSFCLSLQRYKRIRACNFDLFFRSDFYMFCPGVFWEKGNGIASSPRNRLF
jgi:hypothetical protein